MPDRIGPHLLGRKPSPPDERDFQLARFVRAPELLLARTWRLYRPVLDQQQTKHCVGGGWCQWGNVTPVSDKYTNTDLHAVYYECKKIDGEPGNEDGTFVRSGAKAMLARGRLTAYAFAATLEEAAAHVMKHGPVVMGTDWYSAMFKPADSFALVRPTGTVEGGHCYVMIGVHPKNGSIDDALFTFLNDWGLSWGQRGRFRMRGGDVRTLLAASGEACAAVELAAPAGS